MSTYTREYIQKVIESFKNFRIVHDEKFPDNELHRDCCLRFDSVIEALERELDDDSR